MWATVTIAAAFSASDGPTTARINPRVVATGPRLRLLAGSTRCAIRARAPVATDGRAARAGCLGCLHGHAIEKRRAGNERPGGRPSDESSPAQRTGQANQREFPIAHSSSPSGGLEELGSVPARQIWVETNESYRPSGNRGIAALSAGAR